MGVKRWSAFVLSVAGLVIIGKAVNAEVLIDDFNNANFPGTKFITNTNVFRNTVGTTVETDTGLPGVIGGVRTLTVQATTIVDPTVDFMVVGAEVGFSFLDYNSTDGADGLAGLLYDANGAGLNANFTNEFAIRVRILDADAASVPYTVTVKLTDNAAAMAVLTETVTVPGGIKDLIFPLKSFSVDVSNIFSIAITIDPQIAADMRIGRIETIRPPGAPLLSPSMLGGLTLVLSVVGMHSIIRGRFQRARSAQRSSGRI